MSPSLPLPSKPELATPVIPTGIFNARLSTDVSTVWAWYCEGRKAAQTQKGFVACPPTHERNELSWQLGWLSAIHELKHKINAPGNGQHLK